jgi:hypothetical protein
MAAPDASADDSDIPNLRHARPSAIACAVRASSIALKQRAWGAPGQDQEMRLLWSPAAAGAEFRPANAERPSLPLFVKPEVFEAVAVVDAVDHRCQTLEVWLAAVCSARVPNLRHARPSAIACAVRASSIALKQRGPADKSTQENGECWAEQNASRDP